MTWTPDMIDALKYKFAYGHDIKRGKQRGHVASKVVMSGFRKQPKGTDVGHYSYLPSSDQHAVLTNKQMISEINTTLFQHVRDFLPQKDLEELRFIKKMISMESLCQNQDGGCQFAMGKSYWSMCHNDKDFTLSILGVLSEDCIDSNIIYYFLFPDYNLKIPMTNRNLLVFNPHIYHCCSNPINNNSYIFSQYTSQKTILTRASCKFHEM